jgi:4'-phosphopantetheinyl transferase
MHAGFDHWVGLLDAKEQERANRYRFPDDRRRFVCAHVFLRQVLGHHLGWKPEEIVFHNNQWGKPALESPSGQELHFNLSHSEEIVLVAVSATGEVGVDVELVRDVQEDDAIVRRQFSAPEQDHVLQATDRMAAFFEIWTAKEAYIKGIGRGLFHPLKEFNAAPRHGPGGELLSVEDWSEAKPAEDWTVQNLALPEPTYAASLATIGECSFELTTLTCTDFLALVQGANAMTES